MDDLALRGRGPAQRRGQFEAQPFARHLEHVQARVAGGRLEIIAGASVDVEDVAPVVDDDAGRRIARQQRLFQQRGEMLLPRAGQRIGRIDRPRLAPGRRPGESVRQGVLRGRVFARKNFPFLAHHGEAFGQAADALRRAEEKNSLGPERVMEQREQPFLRGGFHIDEQVATGGKIQLGERRVLQNILQREDDQLAYLLLDAVAALLLEEEAREPLRAHVARDAVRVKSGARGLDGGVIQIRPENLHGKMFFQLVHAFLQEHRQRIHLLARRTARHPHAHRGVVRPRAQQLGHDGFGQQVEGFRVAEKAGHADEQVFEQQLQLVRILLQLAEVWLRPAQLMHVDPPFDAPPDGVDFIDGEIVPDVHAQQHEDFLHRLGKILFAQFMSGQGQIRPLRVGDQLARQPLDRQNVIHQPRTDRAGRHPVILRRLRFLGHGHARRAFDGFQTQRAVGARAGEDDADGLVLLILGERAEKIINRQPHQPGLVRCHQMQDALQNGEVTVRQGHINRVRLDDHAVHRRHHAHPGAFAQQLRQQTDVAGMQMRDHDKRDAAIGRHMGKEFFQRLQPASRGTETDDVKGLGDGSCLRDAGGAGRRSHDLRGRGFFSTR